MTSQPSAKAVIIRTYREQDRAEIVGLWQRCGLVSPTNDPNRDIDRKLLVRPDLFLVAECEGSVVGSVMVGYEGHRGWINYLGVCPMWQRHGIGRRLMLEAERRLRAEGCPKINLQVRRTNAAVAAFYRAIGYREDDVASFGLRLEKDDVPVPAARRTECTDVQLRPYRRDDAEALYAAVLESHERLSRWMPWCHPGYGLDDARTWVPLQVEAFSKREEFAFVITDSTGAFIGGCGLNRIDVHDRRANLGYWVRTSRVGRGIATVATRQLVEWSFRETDLERLEVLVAVENVASRRVAVSAGATLEGRLRRRMRLPDGMHDAFVYSFVRSE